MGVAERGGLRSAMSGISDDADQSERETFLCARAFVAPCKMTVEAVIHAPYFLVRLINRSPKSRSIANVST